MLLIAVAGFVFCRKFKFGNAEQKFVSKFLIYLINPCLIVSHFDMEYNGEKLKSLGIVFVLSIIIHFAMIGVAVLFGRTGKKSKNADKGLDAIDKIAVVFTNCGFIGIPLINGVFPDSNGVFYLLAFIVAFNIMLWTFGYLIVCGTIKPEKVITNPNIIAVLIGLVVFCIPKTLPYAVSKPVSLIGSMNSPVAMILLGMLFANFHGFKKEYVLRVAKVCVLRFVVVFAVTLFIVFAANSILKDVRDIRLMCYVTLIAALCPVAMSVSSFAILFGKDESYSGLLVLATSALCVVTLPVSVAIAEHLF